MRRCFCLERRANGRKNTHQRTDQSADREHRGRYPEPVPVRRSGKVSGISSHSEPVPPVFRQQPDAHFCAMPASVARRGLSEVAESIQPPCAARRKGHHDHRADAVQDQGRAGKARPRHKAAASGRRWQDHHGGKGSPDSDVSPRQGLRREPDGWQTAPGAGKVTCRGADRQCRALRSVHGRSEAGIAGAD